MILKRLKIESTTESYTNCYIIEDEDIKEAMVIDPAGEPEKIIETLELLDTKVKLSCRPYIGARRSKKTNWWYDFNI